VSQRSDDLDYWRDHPDPSDAELDKLFRVWFRYQLAERGDDADWWAVEALIALGDEPDLTLEWRVIRRLSVGADGASEELLGAIGAGPLEDLLRRHGEEAMDLIEPAADGIPALLTALGNVWCWDEPFRSRLDRYLASKDRQRKELESGKRA
jgi:hypothetical protein